MWVGAFKKAFQLVDLKKKFFFPCVNSLGGERKKSANYGLFVLLGS